MKKNVILFVIDSFNYSRIRDESNKTKLTPFLERMEKEGISCSNMYSEAPYTEAALMGLKCGQHTLDNGGYLERFNNAPELIYESFNKAGYDVYNSSFQPQCFPSSLRRGITDLYYDFAFEINALWGYRLYYYAELLKKDSLKQYDWDYLIRCLDDNLNEWNSFFQDIENKKASIELVWKNSKNYDIATAHKLLNEELKNYNYDKIGYITNLLTIGKAHSLFKIPDCVQNYKVKEQSTKDFVKKRFRPIFKRIQKLHISRNLFNNKRNWKTIGYLLITFIKSPNHINFKNILNGGYILVNSVIDLDLWQRIKENYDTFKNAPSAITHINHFINWLKKHDNVKPYFACLHVDDIHNPEMFFSYDSDDINLIERQAQKIESYINALPTNYKGSITHDLSLIYIDDILERFYNMLKKENQLSNTIIAITADHGFSFSGYPIRDSMVCNFYLENYNIPFVLFGDSIKKMRITSLCSSLDIPVTLLKLCDIEVPENFKGHSLLEDIKQDHLIIEYMGGGCPDVTRRKINFASYDKDYFIATEIPLKDNLSLENLTEIYDLKADPEQRQNLVKNKTYNEHKVMYHLNILQARIEILRKHYDVYSEIYFEEHVK